jgi:hypothetical protein
MGNPKGDAVPFIPFLPMASCPPRPQMPLEPGI